MQNNKIICLGTNCATRYFLTKAEVKPTKNQGELSMPFDLAVHFPEHISYLIKKRFKYYLHGIHFNPQKEVFQVTIKKNWWKKRQFDVAWLNHDTDLGSDVKKVRERYKKRIKNFWTALKAKDKLFFVQALEQPYNPNNLIQTLQEIRAGKDFHLLILDFSGQMMPINSPYVTMISRPYPYKDYIWYDQVQRNAPQGKAFEEDVTQKIKEFFKEQGCL